MLKIGTRESQLAIWQATLVKNLLIKQEISSELVYIKSEGDVDTITPLYELGVQGIFTKTLDAALLNNRIDIAVHSMKDVPTSLADGLQQAAVLERASYKDILVYNDDAGFLEDAHTPATIATSSIRRKAQWIHRFPNHTIENLRGNVNTRLRKVFESNWQGAIFAAAGLERIDLRPEKSVDLDWMLPSPAQGAIVILCRKNDAAALEYCKPFNDDNTSICTKIEKDFLRALSGGCSTPISALAECKNGFIHFQGNICSTDGKHIIGIEKESSADSAVDLGLKAGTELLQNSIVQKIISDIKNARKEN
ncbi:MAG: hydroxymethylbilane synthase [Ginsengibacter sp.]